MTKRKSYSHMGAWLEVDEENKEVKYRVDPLWLENVDDEELKITLAKLTKVVAGYQRAGYDVSNFEKGMKK